MRRRATTAMGLTTTIVTEAAVSAGGHSPPRANGHLPSGPLIDRQQRTIDYLRVSVTDRCNYRCTYCMPADGVQHAHRADILSFEETARLVRCFTRLGVRRVRLTGGEPTVRRDLPALVAMLREIPEIEDLALSTNGHLLCEMAEPLRRAGVDRLNVSVDTLDPLRFQQITRGGDLARVLTGIDVARAAGYAVIKINTVAVRGFNDHELGAICDYAWQRQLVPRFIEQMPMAEGALFLPGSLMTAAEIRTSIAAAFPSIHFPLRPDPPSRTQGAGPARYWTRHPSDPSDPSDPPIPPSARFGVISPMTEHFCDTCNRVRLSAAGGLHSCLAHDDVTDLRGVLRDAGEDAVVDTIRAAVAGKRDGHTFGLIGIGGPRKAMIQIGG
ncbi:MAG: GTP 3',8-cyclase MoaA [Deltaproteobacteria bacterium]|nr:GTP 3',8-cyclase MoaA [Deltaproteobacteria bacterium]